MTPQKEQFLKYASQYTEKELSEKIKVTTSTIRRYSKEFGIKPRTNKYRNKSLHEWKSDFEQKYKDKIIIIGDLTKDLYGHVIATCKCLICGTTWRTRINQKLSENTGCIHCNKGNHGNKYTQQEIRQKLNSKPYCSWELIYYGDYSNKNSIIRCRRCNQQRTIKLSDFIHTTMRCTNCQTGSFGEYIIANTLRYNRIPFKREYEIQENKKHYRIDFIIQETVVIEYSGEQHFKKGFMYNEKITSGIQSKKQWCEQNNISFHEIKASNKTSMADIIKTLESILKRKIKTPTPEFFMHTDPDMKTVLEYMKSHSARQTASDMNIPMTKIKRYVMLNGYKNISDWQSDNKY